MGFWNDYLIRATQAQPPVWSWETTAAMYYHPLTMWFVWEPIQDFLLAELINVGAGQVTTVHCLVTNAQFL